MAEQRDDGGPAFPLSDSHREMAHTKFASTNGMTLRDYFATHASDSDVQCALEDLGRSGGLNHCKTGMDRSAVARYAHADAMLKARDAE